MHSNKPCNTNTLPDVKKLIQAVEALKRGKVEVRQIKGKVQIKIDAVISLDEFTELFPVEK